jgi:DeoR/GlpR family transcriptional regulator of sugar metabolism
VTSQEKGLRYDSAPVRRERILDLVREHGYLTLGALSRELGVSEMTVRRDVRRLAELGLVRAVHGGVSAVTDLLGPVDFRFRSDHHRSAKRAIGAYAATLLEPNSIIGFDAGTTVLEAARLLPSDRPLTVVTHSLPVMAAVARRPGIQLIGICGAYQSHGQDFGGPLALRALSSLRIQTLLLATTAIRERRLWCTNGSDMEMKQALIAASDRVILLADSSKFAYSALMMVAELTAVATLITDELLTDDARQAVVAAGVELVVVSLGSESSGLQEPRRLLAAGVPQDDWRPQVSPGQMSAGVGDS